MEHVQARLCTKKDRESSFECCGGSVKLLQPCLSVRKELQDSFHHCGGPVKIMQAFLCAGKT